MAQPQSPNLSRRLELQAILEEVLGSDNVYFQPPETMKIEYPAIIYKRDQTNTTFAGNLPYSLTKRYMLTVIDSDPDSDIPSRVARLPMCIFVRHFASDNLNHDIYNLYF